MKKILLMPLLCIAIISCAKNEEAKPKTVEISNVAQKQNIEVPNPFIEVKTLDDASKIAGFSLEVPSAYESYKKQIIQTIENDMIEVIYCDEELGFEGLRIRKAKGTYDICGDYNEYPNIETVKVRGYEVIEKGDGKNIFIATWTDGKYSYAINTERAELNTKDIANLILNIK